LTFRRVEILEPWLPEKGMAMIFAPRSIGKTLLALSIAYAVASGSKLLGWQSDKPRKVLYIDGELPASALQTRLAAIVGGFENEPPAPDYFRLLSADLIEDGLPDLATQRGQRVLDAHIGDVELIVLDNISTLCRSGKENEAEGWAVVQSWAPAHRRSGRSTLFVHHAGKGGLQRGTSKREDVLDTVIALRQPQDYRRDQGARFELHFEKSRGFHGPDAESFEARYDLHDGAALWTRTAILYGPARRSRMTSSRGWPKRFGRESPSARPPRELGIHRSISNPKHRITPARANFAWVGG
jgi:AAA domain